MYRQKGTAVRITTEAKERLGELRELVLQTYREARVLPPTNVTDSDLVSASVRLHVEALTGATFTVPGCSAADYAAIYVHAVLELSLIHI